MKVYCVSMERRNDETGYKSLYIKSTSFDNAANKAVELNPEWEVSGVSIEGDFIEA